MEGTKTHLGNRTKGSMVKQKTEVDNNAIKADKKGQWSCLEQFLILKGQRSKQMHA